MAVSGPIIEPHGVLLVVTLELQSVFRCLQGSFDETKGSLVVQQCETDDTRGKVAEAAQRSATYLALGAAGALLTYLQQAGPHLLCQGCSLRLMLLGQLSRSN